MSDKGTECVELPGWMMGLHEGRGLPGRTFFSALGVTGGCGCKCPVTTQSGMFHDISFDPPSQLSY